MPEKHLTPVERYCFSMLLIFAFSGIQCGGAALLLTYWLHAIGWFLLTTISLSIFLLLWERQEYLALREDLKHITSQLLAMRELRERHNQEHQKENVKKPPEKRRAKDT